MSWRPAADPATVVEPPDTELDTEIEPQDRDLGGGFVVRRVLPAPQHRSIGPWVFFDHFGPTPIAPGQGLDVRPHPHINLATVTYLFEGEILHRDSLGSNQVIRSGDVNWMTAGRGIVHSERTPPALRTTGSDIHGLQLWLGLPREDEEAEPGFHHHPVGTLPLIDQPGCQIRVLVGEAFGRASPVRTFSRVVYLDVRMQAGAELDLPPDPGNRGAYVIEGRVACAGQSFPPARMLVLRAGRVARLRAESASRFVLVGGDPFPEPRHVWWNFVSSSRERIERARQDWRDRRGDPNGPFPLVPGDDAEFIPLPGS